MGRSNILGAWGESVAAQYLLKKRYKLVATNYKSRYGEIDLIVCDRKHLVFVEVKTRTVNSDMYSDYGTPASAVTISKQKRLRIYCPLAAFFI